MARLKRLALYVLGGMLMGVVAMGMKHLLSKDIGGACSEPNYCRGELCVGATPFSTTKDGYCSKACAVAQDCPAGYQCQQLEVEQMGRLPRQMRACLRR